MFFGYGVAALGSIRESSVLSIENLLEKIAIDHFFYQVVRYVEVVIRGLETDARVFLRKYKQLSGQGDLVVEQFVELIVESLSIIRA